MATGGVPRLVNRLCERVLMSGDLDGTRDIDSMRVARAAAELREELDDSDVSHPSSGDDQPVPLDQPMSLPAHRAPLVVSSGVDRDRALAKASPQPPAPHLEPADPAPSPRELPQPAHPGASGGRQQYYWPAATAAGVLT